MYQEQLPKTRQILSEVVYSEILEKIRLGVWKEGEKIPSESDMCEQFQVSRVTVRKALHKLQGNGLIHTHQGQGTFVSYALNAHIVNAVTPVLEMGESDFFDFLQLRRSIEFKAIELAAIYGEESDFKEIEKCFQEMVRHTDTNVRQRIEMDYNFHLAVVKASKNKLFYSIILNLRDVYILFLEQTHKNYKGAYSKRMIENHRKILEGVRTRNAQMALEVMAVSTQAHAATMESYAKHKGGYAG